MLLKLFVSDTAVEEVLLLKTKNGNEGAATLRGLASHVTVLNADETSASGQSDTVTTKEGDEEED